VAFSDLWHLMVWMKSIGINALGRGMFLGKKTLSLAQEYYAQHYPIDGGLRATFEVIWIEGKK
jgi:hypothetical protein